MKPIHACFKARTWFAAISIMALAACGDGSGSASVGFSNAFPENNVPSNTQASILQLTNIFGATLSGAQEVPQRPSGARGSGTVLVNPATLEMLATLTTSGITATAVHIEQGATGANGPIVFSLTETVPGSGIWTLRTTLTPAQFNTMRANGFYFNVRSATFADGEIRGQITLQETADADTSGGTGLDTVITPLTAFVTALRGSQEVPPVTSSALGAGSLLTTISTREVIASVVTSGIAGTAAHIHEGALGVNGPIIVPLVETSAGSGIWNGRSTLSDAQYNALQAGNLYFNVHSAAYPNGEIRGQIVVQRQTLSNSIGPPPDASGSGAGISGGTGTQTPGASLTPAPGSTAGTFGGTTPSGGASLAIGF